jgi:two-component system chemotaxis response regulator CheY
MYPSDTRILVVDDMNSIRKLVTKRCEKLGFTNIKQAEDGEKAWNMILTANQNFQLIISDWNMPNCSGIELLKRIRSNPKFSNIPFIMLTAEKDTSQVTEAIKAGVDNYIVKPFKIDTFAEKILAVYKRRHKAAG